MQKILLFLSCIFFLASLDEVQAKYRKQKYKNKFHHGRSKKRRYHAGNGPDLRAITKNSIYIENPNNGITPIETTGNTK